MTYIDHYGADAPRNGDWDAFYDEPDPDDHGTHDSDYKGCALCDAEWAALKAVNSEGWS